MRRGQGACFRRRLSTHEVVSSETHTPSESFQCTETCNSRDHEGQVSARTAYALILHTHTSAYPFICKLHRAPPLTRGARRWTSATSRSCKKETRFLVSTATPCNRGLLSHAAAHGRRSPRTAASTSQGETQGDRPTRAADGHGLPCPQAGATTGDRPRSRARAASTPIYSACTPRHSPPLRARSAACKAARAGRRPSSANVQQRRARPPMTRC